MQLVPFLFRASKAIPEMDFAGSIVEMGADVPAERELGVGTEVFGSIPIGQHVKTVSGALAEYAVVDCTAVVKKPSGASFAEASGLSIAGCTALDVVKAANLKPGDSVLVNGAGGGIGHFALQICKHKVGETGRVVAICSKRNVEWVKGLGADEVVDYNEHSPVEAYLAETYGATRFNAVVDAVGLQSILSKCPHFLMEGKPYATVGPRATSYTFISMLSTVGLMAKNMLWPRILGGVPRPYVQAATATGLDGMRELAGLVDQGVIKVHISSEFEMKDAIQAYEQSLSGHPQGKIVVKVSE